MKYLKTFENIFSEVDVIVDNPVHELRRHLEESKDPDFVDFDIAKITDNVLQMYCYDDTIRRNDDGTQTEREFTCNVYAIKAERSQELTVKIQLFDDYTRWSDDEEIARDFEKKVEEEFTIPKKASEFIKTTIQQHLDKWEL